jgi:hypothetical protein
MVLVILVTASTEADNVHNFHGLQLKLLLSIIECLKLNVNFLGRPGVERD